MTFFLRIPGTVAARPAAPKATRQPPAGAFTKTDAGRDPAEKADCAVRALAIASGMPYAEAHALLKAAGRGDRCATYGRTVSKAVGRPMALASTYHADRPTFAQWLREHPKGRFMVFVTGHYFAVIDGVQWDMNPKMYSPRTSVHGHWEFPA